MQKPMESRKAFKKTNWNARRIRENRNFLTRPYASTCITGFRAVKKAGAERAEPGFEKRQTMHASALFVDPCCRQHWNGGLWIEGLLSLSVPNSTLQITGCRSQSRYSVVLSGGAQCFSLSIVRWPDASTWTQSHIAALRARTIVGLHIDRKRQFCYCWRSYRLAMKCVGVCQ